MENAFTKFFDLISGLFLIGKDKDTGILHAIGVLLDVFFNNLPWRS